MDTAKDRIIATGSQIQSVYQHEIKLRENFIKVLSFESNSFIEEKVTINEPIHDYLELYQSGDSYLLRILPGNENKDLGSLTGTGPVPEESSSVYKEISMAVSLTPIFRALIEENPDTPWVYYTSLSGFIYIYPWIAPGDFSFNERLLSKDFIVGALPENNPERKIFWTPVYIDEAGKGLMTTISAPVYMEDRYLGSVSIDLHIDKMKWLLNSYRIEATVNHLINSEGEDFLNNNNAVLDTDPEKIPQGVIYPYRGNWITIYSLNTQDWYIMLETDKSKVVFKALLDTLPVFIILLLLSGSMILTFFIIRGNKLLRKSEKQFRTYVENANDIIYSLSVDGVFLYVSPNWTYLLGHDAAEVINKSFERFVHPEDIERCREFLESMLLQTGKKNASIEYRVKHKDGSYSWHASTGNSIYDESGKIISFLGVARDITVRKQYEEELERLVEQKDFLMKELTHRVKNNLMMVSSLISIKSNSVEGIDLSDLISQVNAISFIYEKLYQAESVSNINIRDYIDELLSSIFSFRPNVINTEYNIEINTLSTKTAIPLGLIINEVATNTVKYGIPEKANVLFTVVLRKTADRNNYELLLSNTGNPFPENIELNNSSTLGLRLISVLAAQLEGTIELERRPYPVFKIQFPVKQ